MIREVTKAENKSDALTEFLMFVLALLISTFMIRILWNRSLVKHITIFKPIESLADAFVLALSLQIVRGV
jgi:hypothetical protein